MKNIRKDFISWNVRLAKDKETKIICENGNYEVEYKDKKYYVTIKNSFYNTINEKTFTNQKEAIKYILGSY